jgi:hypothetical protein
MSPIMDTSEIREIPLLGGGTALRTRLRRAWHAFRYDPAPLTPGAVLRIVADDRSVIEIAAASVEVSLENTLPVQSYGAADGYGFRATPRVRGTFSGTIEG